MPVPTETQRWGSRLVLTGLVLAATGLERIDQGPIGPARTEGQVSASSSCWKEPSVTLD